MSLNSEMSGVLEDGTVVSAQNFLSAIWDNNYFAIPQVAVISTDSWVRAFHLQADQINRLQGVYSDTVYPIQTEQHTHDINIGRPDNQFDNVYARTLYEDDGNGVSVPLATKYASMAEAGVEESGNGYIRYKNGIQMCWGTIMKTVTTWSAWGSVYNSDVRFSASYPKAFISTPILNVSARIDNYSTLSCIQESDSQPSNTDIGEWTIARPTVPGAQNLTGHVDFFAIGMWK